MTKDTTLVLAILLTSLCASVAGHCVAEDQLPVEWIAQGNGVSYPSGSFTTGSAAHSVDSSTDVRFVGAQPTVAGEAVTSGPAKVGSATPGEAVHNDVPGQFPMLQVPGLSGESEPAGTDAGFAGPVVTTVSSLLVVLAVFGGMVWISRRFGSARTPAGALPDDVLRNLGSASIDAKTRITFLKVGQRILVIGQTPSGEPQTLSEITDPEEVERLANRCLGRPEIVGRRATYSAAGDYSAGGQPTRRDLAAG